MPDARSRDPADAEPLRVTFTTHLLGTRGGGVQSAMQGLAAGLVSHGHGVAVVGLDDGLSDDARAAWAPATLHPCRRVGPTALGFSPDMARAVRATEPDVLHQHGLWTWASMVGGRWRRTRPGHRAGAHVVSPHNMLDPWALGIGASRKRFALATYERANLAGAGCLHALVEHEAEAIRANGFAAPVCVVPNGVSLEPESRLAPELESLVAEGPYLLYLGRLHAVKNLDAVIDAFERLVRAGAAGGWRLLIAGWGEPDEEDRLRARLDASDGTRVRFVGPVFGGAKARLYARAGGFVLASHREGLPMAALEAMAHGVPSALSDACGLDEAVALGAAVGIDPHEPDGGLERALRELTDLSPGRRSAMSEAAAAFVRERYSWSSVAARLADVYRWIADGGEPPSCVRLAGG